MQEKSISKSFLWLGPIVLGWGGLIFLAYQKTEWAIVWTDRLFGWMILLTYVLLWVGAMCLTRRRRNTLFWGVTFTLTLGFILLCAEIPAALRLVHWELAFQQLTGDGQYLSRAFRRDTDLGFRRRPYDHWEGRPTSDIEYRWRMPPSFRESLIFTYDRWGYRNTADFEQADVALIGDSYVEGAYVTDEHTTAARLQARLRRPVINLGVSGYGTMQESRVLKIDGVRFSPKVVIWFFFEGNDLYDDHGFENYLLAPFTPEQTTITPERWAGNQGWTKRSFTFNVLRWLRRLSDPVLPNNTPYFGYLSLPELGERTIYFSGYASIPWNDFEVERWKKTRDTLTQVAEYSREQGIQTLFAFVPIKFRVYEPYVKFPPDSPCHAWKVWPTAEKFSEFCQSAGVPCLDLTEFFQENIREGGMPYSPVDSHWSPQGHALVAHLLASQLAERGWFSASP